MREARLAEAVGLTAAISLDVVEAQDRAAGAAHARDPAGLAARSRRSPPLAKAQEPEVIIVNAHLTPGAAAQSGEGLEQQGAGPHRRSSWRFSASAPPRREGRLQVELAHLTYQRSRLVQKLDPSGAPARRLRLPGRPGRNPDRNRPAPDRRAHRQHQEGAGEGQAHPRPGPPGAQEGAVPGDRAGRLHQCRQVHPVQPADRMPRSWPRTCCSPPWTPPCGA